MFVDTHAHITSDTLYPEIEALLARAKEASLDKIINICTDLVTLERGLEIAKKHPFVRNVAATTPHDAHTLGEPHFETIAKAAREGHLVAVGETGLEYFHCPETKLVQIVLFKKYIALALETKLPLVIHCRDAFNDLFEILAADYNAGNQWYPGVLHCFTGTSQEAKFLVDKGWYVSFSGIATFKKSETLREAVRSIPLESILIETDSPYLAPQSKRGKQNEPSYIREVAEVIAKEKEVPLEKIAEITSENAVKLFKL